MKCQVLILLAALNFMSPLNASHYRGLSVVNDEVAWMSGSNGAVLRTVDGGLHWDTLNPKGFETKDFRDIHAWNEKRAIVMSSGDSGVVLETKNGGKSWKLIYSDFREGAFLDAFDVVENKIILVGDGIEGNHSYFALGKKTRKLKTAQVILFLPNGRLDAHLGHRSPETNEFIAASSHKFNAFAASGTNILWTGKNEYNAVTILSANDSAWFVQLRCFTKSNTIGIFHITNMPLTHAKAGGAYSLGIYDKQMTAVGGTYLLPNQSDSVACYSEDGGNTWNLCQTMPRGYRSCVYHLPETTFWFCTGTNGTDFSADNGKNWTETALDGFNTLAASKQYLWLAGNKGAWQRIHLSQIMP